MLSRLKAAADAAHSRALTALDEYEIGDRFWGAAESAKQKAASLKEKVMGGEDMDAANAYDLGALDVLMAAGKAKEDGGRFPKWSSSRSRP